MSEGFKRIEKILKSTLEKKKKNARYLHSRDHLLADEISSYFHEPKKFAMYLGVITRVGFKNAYQVFSEIKQSKAKTPAKLFMWKVAQLKFETRNAKIKTTAKSAKLRKKPKKSGVEETEAMSKFRKSLEANA